MTREGGLPYNHRNIDPIITTLSTNIESGNTAFKAISAILNEFHESHVIGGLSNISFGLPARSIINQAFVTLAIQAGMDTAIIDPEDIHLRSMIYAAELVLGRNRHCINFQRPIEQEKYISKKDKYLIIFIPSENHHKITI